MRVATKKMGVKAADERPVLNAHGAKRLPSVEVDSYNREVRDEDGFVGDKASRGAFHDMLERWREPLRKLGADPIGDTSSEQIGKKQLDKLLTEGDPETRRHHPQCGGRICAGAFLRDQALPQACRLAGHAGDRQSCRA